MTASIFKTYYSISNMLHRPSLFPSSFNAFSLLPPRIHPLLSITQVGIFEGKIKVEKNEWLKRRGGAPQKKDQRR